MQSLSFCYWLISSLSQMPLTAWPIPAQRGMSCSPSPNPHLRTAVSGHLGDMASPLLQNPNPAWSPLRFSVFVGVLPT